MNISHMYKSLKINDLMFKKVFLINVLYFWVQNSITPVREAIIICFIQT
jgi:hypothetical protein